MSTEYLLLRGDAHSGAVRGLQHPDQMIEFDGQLKPLTQTSWQKTIWDECYMAGLSYFAGIVGDAPVTLIDGGDLIQGTYHLDDVVTPIMKNQFEISLNTFSPIYKALPNVKTTILLIGTRAHALDEEGTVETVMRDRLRAGGHYTEVVGHGLNKIGELWVDMSHVGPIAGNGFLRGNSAVTYLKKAMYDELLLAGNRPPDLYIRFHYHDFCPPQSWSMLVQGEVITSSATVCPPLCSMNGYARGATRSASYQTIGMLLVEVTDKRLNFFPWVKVYDVRQYLSPKPDTIFYKFNGPGRASGKVLQT